MSQAWKNYFDACKSRDILAAFDSLLEIGVRPVPLTYDDRGYIKRPIGDEWGRTPIEARRTLLEKRIEADPLSAGIGCQPFGYVVFDLDPPNKDPLRLSAIYDDFTQIVMGGEEHPTLIVRGQTGVHVWFKVSPEFMLKWGDRAKRKIDMPSGGHIEVFVGSERFQAQVACAPTEGKTIVSERVPVDIPAVAERFVLSANRDRGEKPEVAKREVEAEPDSWESVFFAHKASHLIGSIASAAAGKLHYTLRDNLLVIAGYAAGVGCMSRWGDVKQAVLMALEENGNCRCYDTAEKTMEWAWNAGAGDPLTFGDFSEKAGTKVEQPSKITVGVVTSRQERESLIPYHDPYEVSKRFVEYEGSNRYVTWKGSTYQWQGGKYVEIKQEPLKAKLGTFTDHYFLIHAENELAAIADPEKRAKFKKRPVTAGVIQSVTQAFLSVSIIDEQRLRAMPGWIDRMATDWEPNETISLANCLLNVRTRAAMAPTFRWFSRTRSPIRWNGGDATCPNWITFLEAIFPDDLESIRLLQQFMGLCLTSDTSWQKILSLVGPPRSGKGTILRIMSALLGPDAVVSLGLGDLSREFGLEKLIGAPLAIMPDVRFGNRENVADAIERLLSISGEDEIRIARKYQSDWSGKLPTRLIMASNEMPRLPDAAAALPTRLLTLHFTESFVGREDTELADRLMEEIEGILAWAVDGYADLLESGRFATNAATVDAVEEAKEIGSPMVAFVRECLSITHNPESFVEISEVYRAYQSWCSLTGHKPSSMTTMVKQIMDLEPKIRKARPGNRSGARRRSLVGVNMTGGGVHAF